MSEAAYCHTQRAPLCWLIYGLAVALLILAGVLQQEQVLVWVFPPIAFLLFVLAASFHYLTVRDDRDCLSIGFGPIPLFRRFVRYDEITGVEVGRTTILDGWGIHLSLRGGWVWNLWGLDCVVLHLRNSTLRVGTDDAGNLARFVEGRIQPRSRTWPTRDHA